MHVADGINMYYTSYSGDDHHHPYRKLIYIKTNIKRNFI